MDVIRKELLECRFRTVSIGLKPVFLHARIQRLECRSCGQTLQEEIKYADEKKYTRTLEKYALSLLDSMTISDVTRPLRMSWHRTKEMWKLSQYHHFYLLIKKCKHYQYQKKGTDNQ